MRVTRRVIEAGIVGAVTDKHVFFAQTDQEKRDGLDWAQSELDRLVILGLTAIFERTVRDYLGGLTVVGPATRDTHLDRVRHEILKDMEFWNISSRVVDVFTKVDEALRGQIKQIIAYRNWVAHGRTLIEPPPVNTNPADAYQRLTDFLTQAGVVTP
ncbi:MAG: hypothetical protein JWO38_4069 [Gemmataceae bacterium]|nr:hypothetical protein [Gemmataceae bacterium]